MAPVCHHNSLSSTRKLKAKLRQEDCLSAVAHCTTDLVSGKSEKSLVPSHSYLNRKTHCQHTEDVFTGKLPVSTVYRHRSLKGVREAFLQEQQQSRTPTSSRIELQK